MKFNSCPQAYKHYSQKQRKTDGIVDLVTNKWLSPNVIANWTEVDLAKIIVDFSNPNINSMGFV
jgi:hypothetical protein